MCVYRRKEKRRNYVGNILNIKKNVRTGVRERVGCLEQALRIYTLYALSRMCSFSGEEHFSVQSKMEGGSWSVSRCERWCCIQSPSPCMVKAACQGTCGCIARSRNALGPAGRILVSVTLGMSREIPPRAAAEPHNGVLMCHSAAWAGAGMLFVLSTQGNKTPKTLFGVIHF